MNSTHVSSQGTGDAQLFPSLEVLRRRGTFKWSEFDPEVLPLFVAESDFHTNPAIKQALRDAVENEMFGYPPHESDLGAATSAFYQSYFGWAPAAEDVFAVADVVRGVSLAVTYLTRPFSQIIIPVPSYMPFFDVGAVTGRNSIFIDVDEEDGLNLEQLRAACEKGAGSLILCNPYNPLGRVFTAEQLAAIVAIAEEFNIRIISDEIHAPVVLEGTHIPVASISETAARLTVTLTAASKAWNIAGLKCAQMLISNPEDAAVLRRLPFLATEGSSILGQVATTAAYRDAVENPGFLATQNDYLRANRDFLVEALPQAVPGAKPNHPDATYLLWIDFRDTGLVSPSEFFLNNAKVMMNDGAAFGEVGQGFARLNFAAQRSTLELALDRMAAAVK